MADEAEFISFCITGSSPIDSDCKILLVGQMTEGTATPNECIQVIKGTEDTLFGANSILAEMVRSACCACPAGLYAIPLEGVGSAAVFELPITLGDDGITDGGTVSVSFFGCTLQATALAGDTAAVVAQAIADAVNDKASFPYTATVAGDSVVFTADNLGAIGNCFLPTLSTGDSVGVELGEVVETAAGAGIPDSTDAIEQLGECCFDCYALQSSDIAEPWVAKTSSTFECDDQQCFSQASVPYVHETAGDLVLEASALSERAQYYFPLKKDQIEFFGYAPWQFAATHAALNCCACCSNTQTPVVRDNGILGCLTGTSNCKTGGAWTKAERCALAAAGAVVWDVNGAGQLYVRLNYTTYKTNASGQRDVFWRDASRRCAVKNFASDLNDFHLANHDGLFLFDNGTDIREGVRGITPNIFANEMEAWVEEQFGDTLDAVDDLDELITVTRDENDPNRMIYCINRLSFSDALLRISGKINANGDA